MLNVIEKNGNRPVGAVAVLSHLWQEKWQGRPPGTTPAAHFGKPGGALSLFMKSLQGKPACPLDYRSFLRYNK